MLPHDFMNVMRFPIIIYGIVSGLFFCVPLPNKYKSETSRCSISSAILDPLLTFYTLNPVKNVIVCQVWSILVVLLEFRFLDTEVDGSKPGNSTLCP